MRIYILTPPNPADAMPRPLADASAFVLTARPRRRWYVPWLCYVPSEVTNG